MGDEFEVIATAAGAIEAEILRGMLEAAGVDVWLRRESAGSAFGLNVGPLGQVDVAVSADQYELAQQVLEDYRSGKLDTSEEDQG
jgi:hypothetical protein